MSTDTFSVLVQRFFGHLRTERSLSDHTVASYRDTFRLLLLFLCEQRRIRIEAITFDLFSPEAILAFLSHIERQRGNCVRTRNARLAAIRAFTRFVLAQGIPEFLPVGQRILGIPVKRAGKPLLGFLSNPEIDAILHWIDLSTWSGRRDHLLFSLLYNTGGRISEVLAIRPEEVHHRVVHLYGKGRRERDVPIWPQTEREIHTWCKHDRPQHAQYLFSSKKGERLSRRAAALRLKLALQRANGQCPSLKTRRVTLHSWRHATAMSLLKADVPIEVIALWMGHEQLTTTHGYIEADLTMKKECLERLRKPTHQRSRRPRIPHLLTFLEAL